uniref:Uncharacterized protein n=1 Tax=Lygus hesperus TaxID=30085 RepID=A0A0A9XCL6_LYGHE
MPTTLITAGQTLHSSLYTNSSNVMETDSEIDDSDDGYHAHKNFDNNAYDEKNDKLNSPHKRQRHAESEPSFQNHEGADNRAQNNRGAMGAHKFMSELVQFRALGFHTTLTDEQLLQILDECRGDLASLIERVT